MPEFPDVLGLPEKEALNVLARAGWEVEVLITYPWRREPAGLRRVIRCRPRGKRGVELVTAHQGWEEVGAAASAADHR